MEHKTHLLKIIFFFLQPNKNPIPLMGCTTQSRESKGINYIHSYLFIQLNQ